MDGKFKSGVLPALLVLLTIASVNQSYGGDQSSKSEQVVKPSGYFPEPVSESSKAGQKIFLKNSCVQCHSTESKGGCLGPVLAGLEAAVAENLLRTE